MRTEYNNKYNETPSWLRPCDTRLGKLVTAKIEIDNRFLYPKGSDCLRQRGCEGARAEGPGFSVGVSIGV